MLEGQGRAPRWVASSGALVLLFSLLPIPVSAQTTTTYELLLSLSPDRSIAEVLSGQTVAQNIYVFTSPDAGVRRVRFYLDDPDRLGPPRLTEGAAPYDFAGTNPNGTAKPFDPTGLASGEHIITAELDLRNGSTVVAEGTFIVPSSLTANPSTLSFTVGLDESDSTVVAIDTVDGGPTGYAVADDAAWLTVSPDSGQTPESANVTVDATGLSIGTYTATVSISDPSGTYIGVEVPVTLEVSAQYQLLVSRLPDRSAAERLEGQVFTDDIYVFTSPDAGVKRVRFYLDDPDRAGSPIKTEVGAPYDLAGTASDGTALPFDPTDLSSGEHTITAGIELQDGNIDIVSGTFTVPGSLTLTPNSVFFSVGLDGTDSTTVSVESNDGGVASYAVSEDAAWLTVSPTSGQTPASLTVSVDARGTTVGAHTAIVSFSDPDGVYLGAELSVDMVVDATYQVFMSLSPDRSNPEILDGEVVYGDMYVFTNPDDGVNDVRFYVDDPDRIGTPHRIELVAPYDLAGTAPDGLANVFDSTQLSIGEHTITAEFLLNDGTTEVLHSTFTVPPALVFAPNPLGLAVEIGGNTSADVILNTDDGSIATVTITDDADWLTVSPTSGATPSTVTISADSTGLTDGIYTAIVTASAGDLRPGELVVELAVGNPDCYPLACEQVLVELPYELDFSFDGQKILDGNGLGTGFSYIDQPSKGTGYIPENLTLDTEAGLLRVTTTSGLAYTTSNSLDNGLAVGVDGPGQVTLVTATIQDPPMGTGKFEQAGLWFGIDEDNYTKLVLSSIANGSFVETKLEYVIEVGGAASPAKRSSALNLTGRSLRLQLRADPSDQTITAYYAVDAGPFSSFGTYVAPPEFFSFDAAGIDPRIGTRSFAGIFASHRNGSAPLVYTFDYFGVTEEPSVDLGGSVDFKRTSFPVPFPTSMAFGPDGRLYVTELFGKIHALTIDDNHQVVDDQQISTLTDAFGASRLTLGIEVDPDSTPDNVILWVAHSNGSLSNGAANSGTVSRISGSAFGTIEHVITGLPRAIANHSVNSIHFAADGKLYVAQGGNTGAGAPNDAMTEFGTRPEQPLSAALLVADVKAAGFEGDCASAVDDSTGTADKTIPATCDVVPYATGLRNMYDFVFHTNGQVYGPDNGLGVKGTFPASPTPDCQGIVAYTSSLDPGARPDPLILVEQGNYYGHPNPARDECVFGDGTFQAVSPLPNYASPIHNLGNHRSANGIIEYTSGRRCGTLQGDLLIANYSLGDDITRIVLSDDGSSVVASESLVGGLSDPLPLALHSDGTIYVGEFGSGNVTALQPTDTGCWTSAAPLPVELLDAGGTALNDKLYVLAGKTSAGHQSTMYVYDPATDSWSTGADLPGPAVENPAVVGLNGKLYAFGGSTAPFSGAVDNAAVYDPGTNTWAAIAPLPTPRGGATAQAINGLVYVVGGMDGSGASLATLEIYDPATNSWTAGPDMAIRRDNPGSAALDGRLYLFGGRTRDADGSEVDPTLSSVEMFDPGIGTWGARSTMPTGRRTMVVGTLNGRAQVMGGEKTPNGGTFEQNEEYDPTTDSWRILEPMPTPRHGAVAGVLGGSLYVTGGGAQGGSSFTNVTEVFGFEE